MDKDLTLLNGHMYSPKGSENVVPVKLRNMAYGIQHHKFILFYVYAKVQTSIFAQNILLHVGYVHPVTY